MSTSDSLKTAVELHMAGHFQQAQPIYQQLLNKNPNDPTVLNLLGLLGWQTGQFEQAALHLERAIQIDSSQPAFFANLGEAYRGLNRIDEAIEQYRRALRIEPSVPVAHVQLGSLLERAGSLDEAIACYERLRLEPNRPDALVQLANARAAQGDLAAAEDGYRKALKVRPDLAAWHYDLGNILQRQGKLDESLDSYQRALLLQPDHVETECNLGNALRELQRLPEALEHLQRAITLRPDLTAARSNLGAVLQDMGRLDEAQACFERALELDPERPEFLHNLGTVLKDQARVTEALAMYDRALLARYGYEQAICSRATALLSLGQFAQGWVDYEQRIGLPQYNTWKLPQPAWDGTLLAGRRLLVHSEQGFGDTLQFIRYLSLVKQRGPDVTLAVDAALIPLLAQSGYGPLVAKGGPMPQFDVQVALMSLPYVFGTELDTVPANVPFLAAEPARVDRWRAELVAHPGLKVGIAWQGRPTFRGDCLRSIPLDEFAPLAAVEGVRLVSLQKESGTEQLAGAGFEVVAFGQRLDAEAAFLDTAAIIQSLDLVITSDTAVAHLAGALAAPVWVALPFAPDWRWMYGRDTSPWYPTMRLFRQTQQGRWTDVFERLAAELSQWKP